MQWDAWNKRRGMDREKALDEYLWRAEANFRHNGLSIEDPDKPRIEAEYEKCVAEKLAEGATKAQLEREKEEWIRNRAAQFSRLQSVGEIQEANSLASTIFYATLTITTCFMCCLSCCLFYCMRCCRKDEDNTVVDQNSKDLVKDEIACTVNELVDLPHQFLEEEDITDND